MTALLFIIFAVLATPFACAATLTDIKVIHGSHEAKVLLSFDDRPVYTFFSLHDPERVVLDIRHSGNLPGSALEFSGQSLLKRIRTSPPKKAQSVRLVLELAQKTTTKAVTKQQNGGVYTAMFTLSAERSRGVDKTLQVTTDKRKNNSSHQRLETSTLLPHHQVVVAIDAGHGGQDPGAIGQNGLQEKNVTLAAARKLRSLLNNDPLFKPVLTRHGDYFISVMGRSEVARKHRANVLVSIHADAALNHSTSGASVWVLSNRRANSEMGNWLEQHEKQSELLGGAGNLLADSSTDPYLSQAVLDLQFGHSQRVGYSIAVEVLRELQSIGSIHKQHPAHASLGVLRSPDIPSLLVEIGFISNRSEEQRLGNNMHQDKIAQAIYKGLRSYYLLHPLQVGPNVHDPLLKAAATVSGSSARFN